MAANVSGGMLTRGKKRAREAHPDPQPSSSNGPDLNAILQRESGPSSVEALVATSSRLASIHHLGLLSRTPDSSPTNTRSDLSTAPEHLRQLSAGSLPTSPFPPTSPQNKPTVVIDDHEARRQSQGSAQAVVGSASDSSSNNRQSEEADAIELVWDDTAQIGAHFLDTTNGTEPASAAAWQRERRDRRAQRRRYDVEVHYDEPLDLQLLFQRADRNHRLQMAQLALILAALGVLTAILLK